VCKTFIEIVSLFVFAESFLDQSRDREEAVLSPVKGPSHFERRPLPDGRGSDSRLFKYVLEQTIMLSAAFQIEQELFPP